MCGTSTSESLDKEVVLIRKGQQEDHNGTSFLPDNDRQPVDRADGDMMVAR